MASIPLGVVTLFPNLDVAHVADLGPKEMNKVESKGMCAGIPSGFSR